MTPERIGKYQIVGKLGQGAMGEVFRGHDPVLNRDVAIKRISSGLDADETLKKRFKREAEAVALLNHPHIITVYELGFEGEQMFMAMELLEGMDLKHAMAQRKLGLAEKLAVMEQICEGLAFAHERDLVHRDLKPANIHILPGGKVKIMDFGLARMSGSDMTSTGTVMGTPHYMSPEQVRGMKADARSDVFALGCVFYELFSGRKPFDAESMHGVLFKVMQEEPAPLTELAPELPNPYVHVIERTLAKEPADRFQSAGELLGALRLARAAGLAPRPAERPAERSGPGTGRDATRIPARTVTRAPERGSMSRATPGHGARNLVIGLLAALVVVLLGYLVLRPSLGGRREAEPPPQVAALLKDAIATRVQLAQRRLDSGDYAAAVRDAESALKLDPANAEAKAILDEASDGARRSEPAARALQQAQAQGGDVTAAAFELMKVDPANAEAQKAVAGAGAAFRPRAEEAQRLAAEAQRAADAAGAARQPAFTAAVALVEQGQQALQSGQFATAARRFLEARIRFERAGRAPKSP
ncbi:MAG TPA: protein kinase [Vicinamibacteria bacterium]|jgi:serine/threonine-protein kinase